MEEVLNIIRDETLTYQQQLLALARLAENMDDTLQRSPEYLPVSYTHLDVYKRQVRFRRLILLNHA